MRNITTPYVVTTSSLWKTPLPYVLGGAIFIMFLIVFALSDLVCSFGKDSRDVDPSRPVIESTLNSGGMNEMTRNSAPDYSDDMEEKVIVIMAGDEHPTFIAMPTSVSAK